MTHDENDGKGAASSNETSSNKSGSSNDGPSAALRTPGFFGFTEEYLTRQTLFSQFLRKVRRAYFAIFHRDYVRQSIAANRGGECHRCGACCKLIYQCPFLGHDSQNLPFCRIYGELRPGACKNYPFDRIDSEIEQCGFRFK